jgi:hypothetical protein
MKTLPTQWIVGLLIALFLLSGCGALTGLPGHGGGKRFAVEQELIAAATRGAVKQIDLTAIRGKKVNLFVNVIGDTGSGNIVGGKYSVVSQLRGDYVQTPPTSERSTFPNYTSTTNTSSTTTSTSSGSSGSNSTSGSSTSGESTTNSVLPVPDSKDTQQKGSGGIAQLGVEYKGLGAYQNSDQVFSSNDLQYLTGIMQTYLFLVGVYVVPPSEAEIDVYITVDVFGTVRSRVEWFLANNEILKAKTSLEMMAVDHLSGKLILPPAAAGAESEYNEQYILWIGPVMTKQTLQKTKPLLCDFTDLNHNSRTNKSTEQDISIPYPFQLQVDKFFGNKPKDTIQQDDARISQ